MSKLDIHRQLWPATFVTDGSLAMLVAEIRAALGDNVRQPVFMRTLHRFGYAFVGPVVLLHDGDEIRLGSCLFSSVGSPMFCDEDAGGRSRANVDS